VEIELAPSLAVKVFVAHPSVELVETVPTVVEIALAAPVEIVAGVDSTVVVPTAVASFGSVEVPVAEQ
jgi:hypothetical protein